MPSFLAPSGVHGWCDTQSAPSIAPGTFLHSQAQLLPSLEACGVFGSSHSVLSHGSMGSQTKLVPSLVPSMRVTILPANPSIHAQHAEALKGILFATAFPPTVNT